MYQHMTSEMHIFMPLEAIYVPLFIAV